jgi:hypothetical protein
MMAMSKAEIRVLLEHGPSNEQRLGGANDMIAALCTQLLNEIDARDEFKLRLERIAKYTILIAHECSPEYRKRAQSAHIPRKSALLKVDIADPILQTATESGAFIVAQRVFSLCDGVAIPGATQLPNDDERTK